MGEATLIGKGAGEGEGYNNLYAISITRDSS